MKTIEPASGLKGTRGNYGDRRRWQWFRATPFGETAQSGSRHWTKESLDLERSLVDRCLSGDETAWEELIRSHTRRVYGLCYRFTGTDAQAQDLTQEVFMRVYRTLKTFRAAEGSLGTWLARLTRNLLIDHYRRTRQERVTDSIEEQLPMLEETVAHACPPRRTGGRPGGQ